MIFVGIGLACITLAFEYWWYKYRKVAKVVNVQEADVLPVTRNAFGTEGFGKQKFGKSILPKETFGKKQAEKFDPKFKPTKLYEGSHY